MAKDGRHQRAPSPAYSEFSLTSTMEHRVFREDGVRRFQARSDEYHLPADEEEIKRLNLQHQGLKAIQHGKNYLAPLDQILNIDTVDKRVLDIGTGTGVWAIEMGLEFPNATIIGMDLAPIQPDMNVPENVSFIVEDASNTLPFPDNHFDVVHSRFIILGIRDWPRLVREIVRILKPNGMFCSVEPDFPMSIVGAPQEEWETLCPRFVKYDNLFYRAIKIRGYDPVCGSVTIPKLLADAPELDGTVNKPDYLPLWTWSDDAYLRRAGEFMVRDTKAFAAATRVFIMDACEVHGAEYDEVVKGWEDEFSKPTAKTACPVYYNWCWKR